jgi:hypothetical protein
LFWIGNHFDTDIRQNYADTLSKAIEQGYTKEMLADTLKEQFNDLASRSSNYWQGLAEHQPSGYENSDWQHPHHSDHIARRHQ